MDACKKIVIEATVQENGYIRAKDGYIIGKLDEHYPFESYHVQNSQISDYYELYIAEQEKRKQLQAENEQLRKDAERYRLMRKDGSLVRTGVGEYIFKQGEYMDETIDKAMAETK